MDRRGFVTTGVAAIFVAGVSRRAAAQEYDPTSPIFIDLPGDRFYVVPAKVMAGFEVKQQIFDAAFSRRLEMHEEEARPEPTAGPIDANNSGRRPKPPPRRRRRRLNIKTRSAAMGVRG